MKTLALFLIAVIIWCAGINGKLGSILAAVVDPGSLVGGQSSTGGESASNNGSSQQTLAAGSALATLTQALSQPGVIAPQARAAVFAALQVLNNNAGTASTTQQAAAFATLSQALSQPGVVAVSAKATVQAALQAVAPIYQS